MGLFPSLVVAALSAAASDAFFFSPYTRTAVYRLTLSGSGDNGEVCYNDFGDKDTGCNPDRVENGTGIKSQFRRTLMFATLLVPISQLNINTADAACLPGDIREDCIGVYKLPMDDSSSRYVETPEKLKMYAPDLKWIPPIDYPSNYQNAINQLIEQRQNFDVV